MTRSCVWLMISGLLAMGCGPDRPDCTGPHPDFRVVLELSNRSLAPDTVVHVTYGGSGMEDYSVSNPTADHEVVFCRPATLDGGVPVDASVTSVAGASGEDDSSVEALYCELWTGGFAKLQVGSASFMSMSFDLAPREHECTVVQTIVLDSPDGG